MYTANGDTTKRWFIYFNAYNPSKKKNERVRVYGEVNSCESFNDKILAITELNKEWKVRLDGGYKFFSAKIFKSKAKRISLNASIDAYLLEKQSYLKHDSYRKLELSVNILRKFYSSTGMQNISVSEIEREHYTFFKTYLLEYKYKNKAMTTARNYANKTINTILADVQTFFNYLKEEAEVIDRNPFKKKGKLPERPYLHEVYTEAELKLVFEYISGWKENLYLFCKFMVYTFLRPQEIVHLQVKHFDLVTKKIILQSAHAKTGRDRRLIPELFMPHLESLNLDQYDREDYIFTLNQKPGKKRIGLSTISKYFTKAKRKLGFGHEYTMYGLKHTFVCHLLENGADEEDVMKMTGHTTKEGFNNYIRGIKARPTTDLSARYSMSI